MTIAQKSTSDKEFEFRGRRLKEDLEIESINMWGGDWYIEIVSLLHGVTRVGTGLFYKCSQNPHTKLFFQSEKECGRSEKDNAFMFILRNSIDISEIHDSVGITKSHFEQLTGLKALTPEEYYEKCESVPFYNDIGASVIDLLSLKPDESIK